MRTDTDQDLATKIFPNMLQQENRLQESRLTIITVACYIKLVETYLLRTTNIKFLKEALRGLYIDWYLATKKVFLWRTAKKIVQW